MRNKLLFLATLLLTACQSVEQLSIDYMVPADVSFPTGIRQVGVVNNVPTNNERKVDAFKVVESLAQSIADENYFDGVIRYDTTLSKGVLLPENVTALSDSLGVDCIISLEDVRISTERDVYPIPEWGLYQSLVTAKVYPTLRIYIPGRRSAMVTINATDSIAWEEVASNIDAARAMMIDEKEALETATAFAGQAPLRHIVPQWKTATRLMFSGGNVSMRDAAVYAREDNWAAACELWQTEFEKSKGMKKMYAAHNLALGYEMQDDIKNAARWIREAAMLAEDLSEKDPTYYMYIMKYEAELSKREEDSARLNLQIKRRN